MVAIRAQNTSPDADDGALETKRVKEDNTGEMEATGTDAAEEEVADRAMVTEDMAEENIAETIEEDEAEIGSAGEAPEDTAADQTIETHNGNMRRLEAGMELISRNWEKMERVGDRIDAEIEKLFL